MSLADRLDEWTGLRYLMKRSIDPLTDVTVYTPEPKDECIQPYVRSDKLPNIVKY